MTTLSSCFQLLDIRALDVAPSLSNSASSSSISSIATDSDCDSEEQEKTSSDSNGFFLKDNSSLVTLMDQLHNSGSSSTISLMNETEDHTIIKNSSGSLSASNPSKDFLSNSASVESLTFALSSLRSPSPTFSSYELQARTPFFSTTSPPISSSSKESDVPTHPFLKNMFAPANSQQTADVGSDLPAPSTSSTTATERPCLPKKLKSSLKLPGLKRSNSLPQEINGSEGGSKQVRFSTNLTRVKTFTILSKPMSISSDTPEPVFLSKDYSKPMFECYDSDNEEESSSDDEDFFTIKNRIRVSPVRKLYSNPLKSNTNSKPYLKLLNFKTPNMLRSPDMIKLVELKIDSINNFELLGVIHVANVSFEKTVEIKYSVDNWKSNFISFANYYRSVNDKVDEFQFKINFKNLIKSKDYSENSLLQICLIYHVNNETFYDNNFNQNYKLTIINPSTSSTYSSTYASNNSTYSSRSPASTSNYTHEKLATSTIKSNFTGDFSHKYFFPSSTNFSSSSSSSSSSSNTFVSSNSSNSSLSTFDMRPHITEPNSNAHMNLGRISPPSKISEYKKALANNWSSTSSPITSPQPKNLIDSAAYNEFLSKYCYKTS